MSDLQKIFDIINKADPEELHKVHADIVERNQKVSPEHRIVSTNFEVDGKLHRVPFKTLREYLQTGKVTPSESQPPEMRKRFMNRIPMQIVDEPASKQDTSSSNDGYYWDNNYNYEYMNPESEKQRVLGKVRK